MSAEIKFGLSRNRLFENSCVSFYGEYDSFEQKESLKAFKMLCEKELLISSNVSVDENGEAFLNTGAVSQNLFFEQCEDAYTFYKEKCGKMIFAFSRLFEFYIVNEKAFMIFANPAVADVKSLYIIAGEFISFYTKSLLDVEPEKVFLFSEKKDIPSNVNSVIIDKVSAGLEMEWQKKPKCFGVEDYKQLYECTKKREVNEFCFTLGESETASVRDVCEKKRIDFCSLCCFAFRKTLLENFKGNKKYVSTGVLADLRLYEDEPASFGAGPFGSRINVVKHYGKKTPGKDEIQLFHEVFFNKISNPFHAYYENLILFNLSPFYCDAALFYEKGIYKKKNVKKLVKRYGNRDKRIMSFDFYNLDSQVWKPLDNFTFVDAGEANCGKYDFEVKVFVRGGCATFELTGTKEKCDENKLKLICEKSVDFIKNVK